MLPLINNGALYISFPLRNKFGDCAYERHLVLDFQPHLWHHAIKHSYGTQRGKQRFLFDGLASLILCRLRFVCD